LKLQDYCIKQKKQYLLDEWHAKKNLPHTPETVNYSSCITVWWKCKKGHCWQTQIKSRSASRTGCPKCFEEELSRKKNSK